MPASLSVGQSDGAPAPLPPNAERTHTRTSSGDAGGQQAMPAVSGHRIFTAEEITAFWHSTLGEDIIPEQAQEYADQATFLTAAYGPRAHLPAPQPMDQAPAPPLAPPHSLLAECSGSGGGLRGIHASG